jgi:hypothetical protein
MSIPWPKKGNKAFVPAKAGAKYFHLPSLFLGLPIHAEAFKAAAEMLLDLHLSENRGPNRDTMLLPVMYLYRHGFELKLKDLMRVGIRRDFFEPEKVKKVLEDHSLAKLWTKVKQMLDDRLGDEDRDAMKGVETVINQFHEADPSSQVFRYARDKDLKPHRHEKLPKAIDIATLRDTMDGVWNNLTASEDMLVDELSNAGW